MTDLMTDHMTSWIISWLIQMVKSGKFHYFLKTLPFISGPLSQGWRGGGTIVKYMKIFTGIDIVDWNQYHFFCLIDDDTFQPGCTAFWISLTLAPGYDFENFLDWPQVSHRRQRRAISVLSLNINYALFRMKTTGPTVLTGAFLKKSQNGLQLLECLIIQNMDKP